MKPPIIIAVAIILIGCAKELEKPFTDCQAACLLSDKYTSDSIYRKTDTLWKDSQLCGRWLDSLKRQKPSTIVLCADRTIEIWRYVIGHKITSAQVLR